MTNDPIATDRQRRRSPDLFVRLFFVFCMAALLPTTAQARPADATAWGVHVCAHSHYDSTRLLCRQNDSALSTSAFAGAQLSITEETVKGHVKNILSKLGANDRTHAVTLGLKRGIIEL